MCVPTPLLDVVSPDHHRRFLLSELSRLACLMNIELLYGFIGPYPEASTLVVEVVETYDEEGKP